MTKYHDGPHTYHSGDRRWYKDGLLHRDDGPACEYIFGSKCWYIRGKLHREDGPACEWYDGQKEWWFNGERIHVNTNEEFLRIVKLKAFL